MTNTERDEIKKDIYRTKPVAELLYINKDGIHYKAHVWESAYNIFFRVPLNDLGEAKWSANMPAQLLLRYLIN